MATLRDDSVKGGAEKTGGPFGWSGVGETDTTVGPTTRVDLPPHKILQVGTWDPVFMCNMCIYMSIVTGPGRLRGTIIRLSFRNFIPFHQLERRPLENIAPPEKRRVTSTKVPKS